MLTDLSQWHALSTKRNTMNGWTLRDAFASDNTRVSSMTFEACGMRFDFSKHLVDAEALELLQNLATARNVSAGVISEIGRAHV